MREYMYTTLIPQMPAFPMLLPEPPHPHPMPLAPQGEGPRRLKERRDLVHEMDDLSEEEGELDDIVCFYMNRVRKFYPHC